MAEFIVKNRRVTFILMLVLIGLSFLPLVSSAYISSPVVSEPVKIEPLPLEKSISILVKATPGTIAGTRELKDSGELVSLVIENEFTFEILLPPDHTERLHVGYKTKEGKEEIFDEMSFVYPCKDLADYTALDVFVYDEDGKVVKEYRFEFKYEEPGFWRKLYWSIRGNETVDEVIEVLKSMPFAVWETFYVTIFSSFIAFIIGLPLGILLVTGDKKGIRPLPVWLLSALNSVINILRSIPFLILMILVIPISRVIVGTSVGTVATIIPLVFAAFPFVARLVETSLREINPNIIEAAQSMGASPIQIITKVMIPESVPSLVSNMTIAVTTILGYSAMSGAIGGGGLGKIAIDYGYYRYQFVTMIVAVILLIILVQIFQSIGTRLAKKLDKRLK